MKQFEDGKKDHAEEQMKNIQQLDNQLGQSQLLIKWDEQIEIPDPIPDEILPIQRENSNPILANVIAH